MSKEKLNDIYTEFDKKQRRNILLLAKIQEDDLKIIKGHLLLEEVLYELLKQKAKKEAPLEKARLSFAQVLCLVESLYAEEDLNQPWLYSSARQLNKIRNLLAHNVEPNDINADIKLFCDNFINRMGRKKSMSKYPLLYSLTSCYSNFAALLTIHRKIGLLPSPFQALSFQTRISASKMIATGELDKVFKLEEMQKSDLAGTEE